MREISSDRRGGEKNNKRNLSMSPHDGEAKKPTTGRFWKRIHSEADLSSSENADATADEDQGDKGSRGIKLHRSPGHQREDENTTVLERVKRMNSRNLSDWMVAWVNDIDQIYKANTKAPGSYSNHMKQRIEALKETTVVIRDRAIGSEKDAAECAELKLRLASAEDEIRGLRTSWKNVELK